MSKKKTIEIPLEVARACLLRYGNGYAEPPESVISSLCNVIKEALPKTREERLGLPWRRRHLAELLTDCDTKVLTTTTATEAQVKLIAHAPEMADYLESLANNQRVMGRNEIKDLLRRAGWIEER